MKINWKNLYILWSVLSLGLLSCAAYTDESPFTRRKHMSNHPKSKQIKLSSRGGTKSGRTSPASSVSLSPLSWQWPYSPPPPAPPRSVRPGKPEAKIQSDFAYLPDVSVTCSVSDFVVRVKPAFYGLGADADELKLGSSCKSNGVLRPYGDLLFTYPVTECDPVRELSHGYLVYKFVLHYEPSQKRFPSRAHPVDVAIECRYQRTHHVHQLSVKPTWQTAVLRKKLKNPPGDIQIYLMDDSWSEPAKSQEYQLGKTVNFQVSASHLPPRGKLYIDSCYAAPSSGSKSPLKYTIIDNFGCMLDSKSDPGASRFISRTDETVRFSLKAFQFNADPDSEISIHCKVSITSEDPDPAHKSCTYRRDRWEALTGRDSICECCDSQCVTSKPRRAVIEGSASSRSLLVCDHFHTAKDASTSREDKTIINRYTNEMHSWENLWGSSDVIVMYDDDEDGDEGGTAEQELEDDEDSRASVGVMTEPRLHKDLLDTEEQEKRFDEKVDEISDKDEMNHLKRNSEVFSHWVQPQQVKATPQSEVQMQTEDDEDNSNYAVRGEDDEKTEASEVEWKNDDQADVEDDGEMTWYFTWG